MRQTCFSVLIGLFFGLVFSSASNCYAQPTPPGTDLYEQGPDSKRQEGVPQGKVTRGELTSQAYNGRKFNYQVYVPAQYDGSKPAAVMVFQDGSNFVREKTENGGEGGWKVPIVFDNLIHKKEIPLIIGIFIDPTNQRAQEYDTLSGTYAKMVVDEMLPAVGQTYKLTSDPDGHAIAGFSSGAIAAFTVAWERPNDFRKVASFFGSFTSIGYQGAREGRPMRPGGDVYPTLIRKNPIKPIKIFIQDGSNDLNNQYGNWYLANRQMASALEWANMNADARNIEGPRYQYQFAWGDGGHTAKHGGSIFPDVMRWMWKDYEPK